jgi:hypothetical protein
MNTGIRCKKPPTGVQPEMCATCPFRHGSKYAHLQPVLAQSALTEATRICHSTGSNNGINRRTGKPPMVCRGSRDLQLRMFAASGFLREPTDACWVAKVEELSLSQG